MNKLDQGKPFDQCAELIIESPQAKTSGLWSYLPVPQTHICFPEASAICIKWSVTLTSPSGLTLQQSCFLVWLLLECLCPQATHSREQSSWVRSSSLRHHGELLSFQKEKEFKQQQQQHKQKPTRRNKAHHEGN